jgi:hypothetical protein
LTFNSNFVSVDSRVSIINHAAVDGDVYAHAEYTPSIAHANVTGYWWNIDVNLSFGSFGKRAKPFHSRPVDSSPRSLQDRMAIGAARRGEGRVLIPSLNYPKGHQKIEVKVKSDRGRDSIIHYQRDPVSGRRYDFKFDKHSTDGLDKIERVPNHVDEIK